MVRGMYGNSGEMDWGRRVNGGVKVGFYYYCLTELGDFDQIIKGSGLVDGLGKVIIVVGLWCCLYGLGLCFCFWT